ncbi:MAG: hypothetical protein QG574_621 [Cyanobacteriota bacterium erpe_2018_sw_21hr_WHONDRS-SW48-000092_B_bin.40]|nr:hypothetical protein [Cyanobacteriota bacterium erpe_2018_sw_21hr_WHONDRS-SW48-000092_B_bin.40]
MQAFASGVCTKVVTCSKKSSASLTIQFVVTNISEGKIIYCSILSHSYRLVMASETKQQICMNCVHWTKDASNLYIGTCANIEASPGSSQRSPIDTCQFFISKQTLDLYIKELFDPGSS